MNRSFFEMINLINEAPLGGPAGAPMGSPPGGLGSPGGDLGGLGGPPGGMPLGGGLGGPPGPPGLGPGGGMGGGEPVPIKTIAATDVWKLLEKVMKDEKFIEEIRIDRKKQISSNHKVKEKKNSLLK